MVEGRETFAIEFAAHAKLCDRVSRRAQTKLASAPFFRYIIPMMCRMSMASKEMGGSFRIGRRGVVASFFLVIAAHGILEAATLYVAPDGTGAGNDWSAPASLTNALATAAGGSEIWLAQGTYTNTATFTVRTNCVLYGGFTNGMAALADRNWTNYPTILDGRAQNLRVVTITGTNVTLDGLIVSNSYGASAGGLAKAVAGVLTLANCRIVAHSNTTSSGGYGVGASLTAGNVVMTNCLVANNTKLGYSSFGFGVYSYGANLQLIDCLFSNNNGPAFDSRTGYGVALSFDNGTLNALRTDFIGNAGGANNGGGGGAVYLGNGATMAAIFSNCVFRTNVALYLNSNLGYGGAIWANLAGLTRTVTVVNCTFKDNLNDGGNGGAIYVSAGTLVVKNSIFWTNGVRSGYSGSEVYATSVNSYVTNSYSRFVATNAPQVTAAGGALIKWGEGVMTNNPLYASATDVHLQSSAGRWENGTFVTTDTVYSPCIDAGDPASPWSLEPDPNNNRVNIGAYGNTAQASKSPNAAPQIADRGLGFSYTKATFSGELVNASAVIADVGICYGTNSVAGDTTAGWQYVDRIYPPQRTGAVFSVTSPYLLTNTTYYYRWFATNAYGSSWMTVSNFTTGSSYPPGWGAGGGTNVIHVKKDATGNRNGLDWFNAYTTIGDGYAAVSGSKTNIWITGGVYVEGGEITVSTSLAMIGGFVGTESSPTERASTNAQGVVTNYTWFNAEGLTRCLGITAGNVWLDTLGFSSCIVARAVYKTGGGALTMNNCRIAGNSASGSSLVGNGVGGYFSAGTILMTNCLVANNTELGYLDYGFGVYSSGANLQLVDCLFSNNYGNAWLARSGRGTGLAFDNGTLMATRTDFINNRGPGHYDTGNYGGGGAVYLGNGATMQAAFSNCVFRDNQIANTNEYSTGGAGCGGAIWVNLSSLSKTVTVANCTFKDNVNDKGNGGAIYVSVGTLVVKNSIFWTNGVRSGYSGSEIYATSVNSYVTNSYSRFVATNAPQVTAAGGAVIKWGEGVMTNNPLYASATDVHLQSSAGRWENGTFVTTDTVYSPCIDAGDPASPWSLEPDPNNNRVNIGAYGNTAQASKSPNAAPQIADRGLGFSYTKATFSGELVNASAVIADVGICYGTNSVAGDTTAGWQYVDRIYPPQQTNAIFTVTSPYLLANTTYYYRWFATNAYGSSWMTVSNFTTGSSYPPGWGVGGGANVIHVKKDAVGNRNGQDWFNAYPTITEGYGAVSGSRTNIWITSGLYAESAEVTVTTNLAMIGGFAGTESSPTQRASTAQGVVTNYTWLDAEGLNRCLGIMAGNVRLDTMGFSGCIVGRALYKTGGGMLTMDNCRIVGNSGAVSGGGGYFTAGTVFMTNCVVVSNSVTTYSLYGFGLYSSGVNLQLVDCLLLGNYGDAMATRSGRGVGLAFDNGSLLAIRTDFIGNAGGANNDDGGAAGGGGGVYLGNSATMSAAFSNCVFRGNAALYCNSRAGYGGAMWVNLAGLTKTVTVVNCTFKDNLNDTGDGATPGLGGAICLSKGTMVIRNSIFWTNSVRSGLTGREIYASSANSCIVGSYSCFAGTNAPCVVATNSAVVQWGTGMMVNDPLYAGTTDVHLKSRGGHWDAAQAGWVKDSVTSPCLDAGDPVDPVGSEPPPNGKRIDMGAYGGTEQASKLALSGTVFVVY
jgi:hypothetical protein